MKKKFLQRTAALVIMTLLLSVTALAGSQDTAPVENTDAAGTESVSEIEEEGEETEVDPAKLEDENPSFQIASEEIAPLGMTGEQTAELQIEGKIKASPAVYNDIMVIGTTGKGTEFVYGIQIR